MALMGLMCHQTQAQCDTVRVFPWTNNFYSDFGCWGQLGDSSSLWQLNANDSYSFANAAFITAPPDSAANGCVLVSPALTLPADTANMRLSFRTRRVGTVANLWVLVSTGSREDLTAYDTLLTVTPSGLNNYEVNLSPYAGQTIYVAFSIVKPNPSNNLTFFAVGNLNILSDHMPQGEWLIQNMPARTADTVEHEFYLTQGIENDSNTTFVWNSTMVAAGQATLVEVVSDMLMFYDYDTVRMLPRSLYRVVYQTAGTDTVTVTASNIYGTITSQSVSNVYDCAPISSFPWTMEPGDLSVCGTTDFSIQSNYSTYSFNDEDGGVFSTDWYMQSPSSMENILVTGTIAVPADAARLALTLRWRVGVCEVRAARVGQNDNLQDYLLDTTLFTDLLFNEGGASTLKTRKVSLAAYAGDTIRLAVIHKSSNYLYLMPLSIDYDTLPKIASVQVPSLAIVDSAALCTATLRYGATEGLHYSWSSAQGGTFVTNALGDSAWVTYPAGVGENDTIRVVASNTYGTDTVVRTLRILDCTPQLVLPWKETFGDGFVCWYKPEGSNWTAGSYYGYEPKTMASICNNSPAPHWIMSKAVALPADTALRVRLFWDASTTYPAYRQNCGVYVTTSEDYTDTANYTLLYLDTAYHTAFTSFDHLSVPLTDYAGQTVHVAFRNMPYNFTTSATLHIDNVIIRSTALPIVNLAATTQALSHETVTHTATLTEGSDSNLTITWHSSLMDTTWVDSTLNSQLSSFNLIYTLGGRDTITVTASNIYGSYTVTSVVVVTDCTPIATLPWEEDFNNVAAVARNAANGKVPNCWNRYWSGSDAKYTPHVISNYPYNPISGYFSSSNRALLLQAGTTAGYDSVAMVESPAFDVPLNGQLLSFYYMHESASSGTLSVGYLQDGAFVGVADMEPQVVGRTDTVSLQAIPAEVNRFALQWKKTGTWYGVIVDDLRVFARDTLPTVRIEAPTQIFVGDPTAFRAVLYNGLTDGLTYTWHSSLTGTTWNGAHEWNVTYNVGGYDTVSVIAANAYGADTAQAVVYVDSHPLPLATLTAPTSVYVGDSVTVTATINDCSQNGLAFSWHSSMLDTTITLNSSFITLNYTAGGTDTVTFIVSNAYGADTAVTYIYVVDCNGAMVPYVETFEEVTPTAYNIIGEGHLPLCWEAAYNGTNANIILPKVVNSYQFITGLTDNALLLIAGGGSTHSNWVQAMLPTFSLPLPSLVMSLDYRYESANAGTLTVGYVDDTLGFFPVKTLTPHAGSYTRDTVHFAGNVASYNGRIALRFAYNTSFYGVVVNNIEVISGNGIPTPLALTVDSVSASCASFSWSPVDSATAYVVTVEGVGDTVVSGTAVTFCGLNQESDYSVKVAAIVGTDTGLYTPNIPFSTLPYCASPVDVAVTADGVVTWQYATSGQLTPTGVQIVITDTASGAVVVTDTVYGNSYTPSGLYPYQTYSIVVTTLCGGVSSNSSNPVIVTTPPAACSEVRGDYNDTYNFLGYYDQYAFNQMIYPAQMLGSVDTLFGIALRVSTAAPYNPDRKVNVFIDHTTSTSLASAAVSVTGMTQTAHTADFNTADTGWTAILFDTPFVYNGVDNLIVTVVDVTGRSSNGLGIGMHSYQGDSYRYLLWLSSSETIDPYSLNFTTSYNYYRAPDIQFLGGCTNERCVAPVVVVDSATTNALYLRWQRQGSESHYQVEYSLAGADSWTVADTTSATAYILGGLAGGTLYHVRVGAVCVDSTVLYRAPSVAGTLCGPVTLPHYSNFAVAPGHCWTGTGSYSENNGYDLSGVSFDHPDMLISPEVAGGLHAASVTIRARDYSSYDDARYAVGVSNADGSEVVWIDTVDFTDYNNFEDATVYLNSYTGTNNHVAIAGILSYTLVRSVSIDPLVGCLPVQRAWVNRIADTSATLHWIPEQTGDQFLVYLGDSLMTTTTDTFFTFTGLAATTAYTARVVEQCSAGGLSVPVSIDFTTACTPLTLPWSEDFTGITIGEMPSCWTTHLTRRYTTTAQVSWPDSWYLGSCRYLHLKSEAGTVANPDTTYKNYASTPLLNVGSHGAVVTVSAQGNYGSLLQVGVMTDPSDPSTFVPALEVPLHPNGFSCSNFMTYQFSTDTLGILPDVWAVAFHWKGVSVSMVGEVSVDPISVSTYDLTLGVNDTTMGTVSGAGTYEEGTVVTITATPNEGYHFVVWSDSVTTATRTVKVDTDTTLTAYFEADSLPTPPPPDTVWYTVTVNRVCRDCYEEIPDDYVTGEGLYPEGSTVTLTGFVGGDQISLDFWIDEVGDTIFDNPYSFVINSDRTLTAVFGAYGGIDNVSTYQHINVYPNPASTTVTIETDRPASLTLTDATGRECGRWKVESGKNTIDISSLPAGVYFVRLAGTNNVRKLIIK